MKRLQIPIHVLLWVTIFQFVGAFSVLAENNDNKGIELFNQETLHAVGQDTSGISDDTLKKMVPYLDNVKADSKNELLFLYIIAIILSTFISEDLACIGAGIMVANGLLTFWPAAFGAIAGIYIGDFSLYFAGRLLGRSIFTVVPFKWFLTEESVNASMRWFNTKGPYILFASRFIPGSRFPVYLTAGILKTPFWKFLIYFGLTVLVWTPIFVWISVFAGNEIFTFYEKYDDYAVILALGAIIVLFLLYKLLIPLFTVRGRRVLWEKILKLLGK